MHQKESWDKSSKSENDGKKLNIDIIKESIENNSFLVFRKITNKKVSERTNISLRTVSTILNRLKDLAILSEQDDCYKIVIPKGLIDKGFLDLPKKTELKGMQLVFWAFVNERLEHYNVRTKMPHNILLDTWASRLAMDMGVKKKDVQNYIHCLSKRNYLARSGGGKLVINKFI